MATGALLALAFAHRADGGTASSPFTVTGTVVANCTISATGPTFTYDPVGANAGTAAAPATTGSIVLACTKGSTPSLSLDAGLNAASAPAGSSRALKSAAGAYLGYDLYQPGGSTVWTTTATYNPGSPASKAARTINFGGTIPGGQDVATGSYTDTVTVTVNF